MHKDLEDQNDLMCLFPITIFPCLPFSVDHQRLPLVRPPVSHCGVWLTSEWTLHLLSGGSAQNPCCYRPVSLETVGTSPLKSYRAKYYILKNVGVWFKLQLWTFFGKKLPIILPFSWYWFWSYSLSTLLVFSTIQGEYFGISKYHMLLNNGEWKTVVSFRDILLTRGWMFNWWNEQNQ